MMDIHPTWGQWGFPSINQVSFSLWKEENLKFGWLTIVFFFLICMENVCKNISLLENWKGRLVLRFASSATIKTKTAKVLVHFILEFWRDSFFPPLSSKTSSAASSRSLSASSQMSTDLRTKIWPFGVNYSCCPINYFCCCLSDIPSLQLFTTIQTPSCSFCQVINLFLLKWWNKGFSSVCTRALWTVPPYSIQRCLNGI